ncbi:hypothetical protein KP509_32G061400 [Ceratopteris richardii]|uniref:MYND-type domain-containing protein n=1 Tax=Ceratopteris richardii TaxID=49495 RepID=A0A8T2QW20_CERRI|nr:hypothetical protein KP509_32G061400 [Ceratopteris richardii]
MRTRKASYPSASDGITFVIKPRFSSPKRSKLYSRDDDSTQGVFSNNPPVECSFDVLHDELLISIMLKLSSSAARPSDLINAMLTCKRFCAAATHRHVLSKASVAALAVKAKNWSDGAARFLLHCARYRNMEAAYMLGMIRFYCLNDREIGATMMAQAALRSHAAALHSLAIIQFNGSGGSRKDKNLKHGVSLCSRAAALGHIDAIRELGHCLQDGYGVRKNVTEGRRLLLQANALEAAAAVASCPRALDVVVGMAASNRGLVETALSLAAASRAPWCSHYRSAMAKVNDLQIRAENYIEQAQTMMQFFQGEGCSLLSDFGINVPSPKLHIANEFLVDWFDLYPPQHGLRLCSHGDCGRPETRRHEFRRCSACGTVNYCSRGCQALDWKLRHKYECKPVENWEFRDEGAYDEQDRDQLRNT